MPRGRHRHSPPLHKLLPPSTVAGASLVCAAGAWFVADPVALRVLVAAAAVAAVTGAALMRGWDRKAGRRVAELTRAREADVWKAEERAADVEADLEESRALRSKLETKLRAKRVELAGLRGEHAALLRRYATAETERATALERRRQLALETAAANPPRELPAANSTPTPAAYMRAAAALESLGRNGAAQRERAEATERAAATARAAEAPATEVEVRAQAQAPVRADAQAPAAADAQSQPQPQPQPQPQSQSQSQTQPQAQPPVRVDAQALAPVPASGAAPVPASGAAPTPTATPGAAPAAPVPTPAPELREHMRPSAALAPYAPQNLPAVRKQGGFDFFGTGAAAQVQHEDLADVVGEEALADHRSSRTAADSETVGEVIDLTAHDETEQLDVADLRSAVGS